MRTVTFYSYKGGTGRTLLLANVAVLAARMGWKVVAIDVDLEAPGLTYKLFEEPPSRCDGLVGWLRDRFQTGRPPLSLGDSLLEVELTDPFEDGGWLKLMPAGRHPSMNYFQDFIGLRLEQRINDGPGVDAFVDLQEQVRDELAPDLLLLDARTGISSTNLVTTRVLADDVVALTLDSREQLDGTRSVLRSLTPLTSLRTGEELRLHVVLSRIEGRPADIGSYALTEHEHEQIARVRSFLREPADPLRATLTIDRIHLVHSEPSLLHDEFLALAQTRVLDAVALHVDCLRIAESVLPAEASYVIARTISERSDPWRREQLATFFARPPEITEARRSLLHGDGRLDHVRLDLQDRVEHLDNLAAHDATLRPDLARALLDLAAGLGSVGRRGNAIEPLERAVEVNEELAATDSAFLGDLGTSLTELGVRYWQAGRLTDAIAPAERAVTILEQHAARNPSSRQDLARSLTSLAHRYSEVGRRADAVEPLERAAKILDRIAEIHPEAMDDLARALTNLGAGYADVGRRDDAISPSERAVEILQRLADTLPAYRRDLAGALNNLAIRYGDIARGADAIGPAERAVEIREQLATSDPALLGDLAQSLTNVGALYHELGRHEDAVAATERAVHIYEAMATSNPIYRRDLAGSLTNLGAWYSEVGRGAKALEPAERAVAIYSELAAQVPSFRDDLARSLTNFSLCLARVGSSADALAPMEHAVAIEEQLAAVDHAFDEHLARALINLGDRHGALGRHVEAIAHTARAVAIYKRVAAGSPAFAGDLATALGCLVRRMVDAGEHQSAIPPAQAAVRLRRTIAEQRPDLGRPPLAAALRELAMVLSAAGDDAGAHAAADEASRLVAALLDDV